MKQVEMIRNEINAASAKSAWAEGVKAYAIDLVDTIAENGEGKIDANMSERAFRKILLNGAQDWKEYSYAAMSLYYDEDIAARLCAPWELRKTNFGKRQPNSRENWLDVQAHALYQAAELICSIAFGE